METTLIKKRLQQIGDQTSLNKVSKLNYNKLIYLLAVINKDVEQLRKEI